jgi:hypothetical protein
MTLDPSVSDMLSHKRSFFGDYPAERWPELRDFFFSPKTLS